MAPEVLDLSLVGLALASAVCCIAAGRGRAPRLFFVTKPLTMVFVIAIALRPSAGVTDTYRALVLLGLAFSLAGDVFLMLPSDRFVAGLASFLLGHLCYVAAFSLDVGLPAALVREPAVLLLILSLSGAMYVYLWPGLSGMRVPVVVYVSAIAAMAWQATARALEVDDFGALLACIGALLFVVSDSVLAVDRFRRPFALGQVVVLGTYFPAQLLIALSVGGGAALAARAAG